jgi:thiol peroxidase
MLLDMKAAALFLLALGGCPKESAPPPPPPPEPPKPIERTDVIKRGDKPLTLVGKTLDVGDRLPDVTVAGPELQPIRLADYKGKVLVLSVVPSIDTPVCEAQTHHVSEAMDKMGPNTAVITVSRDLPFAQARFKQEAMTKTDFGSDYNGGEFGRAFGASRSRRPACSRAASGSCAPTARSAIASSSPTRPPSPTSTRYLPRSWRRADGKAGAGAAAPR